MLLQRTTEQQFERHESTYTDFFLIDISEKILKSCNSLKKKRQTMWPRNIRKIKRLCHECMKYMYILVDFIIHTIKYTQIYYTKLSKKYTHKHEQKIDGATCSREKCKQM